MFKEKKKKVTESFVFLDTSSKLLSRRQKGFWIFYCTESLKDIKHNRETQQLDDMLSSNKYTRTIFLY